MKKHTGLGEMAMMPSKPKRPKKAAMMPKTKAAPKAPRRMTAKRGR